jgi:hypothetical protein
MDAQGQTFHLIGWIVFGLAVSSVGLVWLLAGMFLKAKGLRRLAVGLAGISGVAAMAAYFLLDDWTWLWLPLLAVVPVPLLAALACWVVPTQPGRLMSRLVGCVPVQALVLLVGGLVLAGSQLWRMDEGLQRELNRAEAEMALVAEPPDLETTPSRVARTDSGNVVPLFSHRTNQRTDAEIDAERRYLQAAGLERKLIQTGPLDPTYNCHGWVFAAGRFWVRSAFVEQILKDNRYQISKQVAVGDVAVFRNNSGEVTHTGLVRSVSEDGLILLESKWGRLGRYVHTAEEHAYRGHKVTYYRAGRANHYLQGLSYEPPGTIPNGI